MTQAVASIDLGSHTARLLIAQRSGSSSWGWTPLLRQRAYIRLAADRGPAGEHDIGPAAMERAVDVLRGFSRLMADYHVSQVHAVATGIIRDAIHGHRFLARLHQQTGIPIELVSGEKEALLSGKGACAALNISGPYLVFDLGGGTTEFLRNMGGELKATSISLGAGVLTGRFIRSDPPAEGDLVAISGEVEQRLNPVESDITGPPLVVGTGGSITTLAAMVHKIGGDAIGPDRINGLTVTLPQLETCLTRMRILTTAERVGRLGLDPGRADVIVAGSLAIIGIMKFLGKSQLVVSMSDLLEGLLMDTV
jgi:exopolyphosphatase / guanosine-5'-triphosphate,3'-diphosphate pyrophosphatase